MGRLGGLEPGTPARELAPGCRGVDLELTGAFKRPDRELLLGSAAFVPTSASEVFTPNGESASDDFWKTASADRSLHAAVDGLEVGQVIKRIRLRFYKGAATAPVVALYGSLSSAAASLVAPTVAWSAPGSTGNWTTIEASYLHTVVFANYQLFVLCKNLGDRVRMASVLVGDP